MASDRAKPVLDEQSFQGLLAAAFTIQEHNARMNSEEEPAAPLESPPPPKADLPKALVPAPVTCSRCGAALANANGPCPSCNGSDFRPGERLQRNWASLWQMGQEQGLWTEARKKPANDGALSPADPARRRAEHLDPNPTAHNAVAPDPALPSRVPASSPRNQSPMLRVQKVAEDHAAEAQTTALHSRGDSNEGHVLEFAPAELERPAVDTQETTDDRALAPWPDPRSLNALDHRAPNRPEPSVVDDEEAEAPAHAELDDHAFAENAFPESALTIADSRDHAFSSGHDVVKDIPEEDFGEAEDVEPEIEEKSHHHGLRKLRLKLQFQRADIYLGLAIVVAIAALLWPTAGQQKGQPELAPWERVLIAMGIAEAPQPTVHFHGDPGLKVWVDTHTALYYCPGDELYGKSPDGHYSTQREAQMDRFEPAERSVCIE